MRYVEINRPDQASLGEIRARELLPRIRVLAAGLLAVAIVSIWLLPSREAVASIVLGALTIAAADVDARTFLLPNLLTRSIVIGGVVAAVALNPVDPLLAALGAVARAVGTVSFIAAIRWAYRRARQREGMGFGDVKLAAGIGAWLPMEAIPLCFLLAALAALLAVISELARGRPIEASTRVPFGAFLCFALWTLFFLHVLGSL